MKALRALSLSALVLTAASLTVVACGSDDPTVIYLTPDSGVDSGRREGGVVIFPPDDGGEEEPPLACQPQTPPARTFTPTKPFPGKCTLATIDAIQKSCLSSTANESGCNTAIDQTDDSCFDCLFNVAGAKPNAALVQFDQRVPYSASLGTCVTAVGNDSDPDGCGVAIGELDMCTKLACVTPCLNQTAEARVNCEIAARQSVCNSPASRKVFSDACQKKIDDGAFGSCFDDTLTNDQYISLIMRTACGPGTGDAGGPKDAGPDADADANP